MAANYIDLNKANKVLNIMTTIVKMQVALKNSPIVSVEIDEQSDRIKILTDLERGSTEDYFLALLQDAMFKHDDDSFSIHIHNDWTGEFEILIFLK